ncbi:GTPase [Candidatus Roizmanbacteria bacterium RIFCSPHIGHO2_02_FULL_37_13b]|uniref:GTPase n=1 Tax=Candidatus Roizmanbacteria bacterium RIFCSPLOWO2_02_FULL_36_11 TaxID=1802071 RepID=A0A1F7JGH1_9BACT|nr:MAG: GTPase [Candidatus Roizmanbacteria bacterium RIFCSPHIGHO2_02_FULL_37_13b]OGK54708.1 MAG: GTPase [Candidatus Roizmanbacteria bacterium RIFCSPLOWO2_02_FULL_36_11]
MKKKNVIIMGAAGRDFHNFNTFFRGNKNYNVVAFTAFQIPNIEDRRYPKELAGKLYPKGINIYPESELPKLITKFNVDVVVFSYSDVYHKNVMHKSSIVNASGPDFWLLGPKSTMIKSKKPVISVCAVRTGCGKSQTSRKIAQYFKKKGKRVSIIRHPMPYGVLKEQIWQRFATYEDFVKHKCTIEELEEYEPVVEMGMVIWSGVDYGEILRRAEKQADVILWDGGNNDFSFYKTDLNIVVVDPHRPGHELKYYPGETNFRMADVIVINKMNTATKQGIEIVKANIKAINPKAIVIEGDSIVTTDKPDLIKGKKVVVVEDGPTLTHGEMTYGAGMVAAKKYKAKTIVDPRPYAVGSIAETFKKYSHMTQILPAMGYGKKQMHDLEKTINAIPCDTVVVGTPIDLSRWINIKKPSTRVHYELQERGTNNLNKILSKIKV